MLQPITPSLMTPSKVAAAQLDVLSLTKPNLVLTPKIDETTTDGRDRFVGNLAITCDKDEPLLKPTDKRFVLFPIQLNEVSSDSRSSLEKNTSRVGEKNITRQLTRVP